MANINKYWVILESLQFLVEEEAENGCMRKERLNYNIKKIRTCINLIPEEVIKCIIVDKKLKHLEGRELAIIGNLDDNFLYCLYSLKMLLTICENVNFSSDAREDLISEKHKSLIISSIKDVASISLQENLHPAFYKSKRALFKKCLRKEANFYQLEFIIQAISTLMHIKPLHVKKPLNDVQLWYMAAIFSIFLAIDSKEYSVEQSNISDLQSKLQKMWLELSKKLYYRNLMLMYSSLHNDVNQRIHREMLLRLWSPGGFTALLFSVVESRSNEEQSMDEIIANIVAHPSYSTKAQRSLIKQIFQFLRASVKNKEFLPFVGAGILSLRKLYENNLENKEYFTNWIKNELKPIINTEESNLIAMEWLDFTELISLLFHTFCTSSIATLPSELLIPYIPLLLDLYNQVQCHANQDSLDNHLSSLVLQVLNNRSKAELKHIIESLTLSSYSAEWFYIHPKIHIVKNPLNAQELKLNQIESDSSVLSKHVLYLKSLIAILKHSTYNLLTYQLFIILLQLVPSQIIDNKSTTFENISNNIDLLETEDLYYKVTVENSQNFESKFQIIKSLESLIQHQPLKTLINDNTTELLNTLQEMLLSYTTDTTKINPDVLIILLILIREIVENCTLNSNDIQTSLVKTLKQLELRVKNGNLKYQLNCLINLIQGESFYNKQNNLTKNQFEEARALIESNKSYLQVEGIEMMIKLVNKQDKFVLGNRHLLTALALNTLKSPESYTFLNCVRLFATLVNVNESEVLELLSDEYLNEASEMDYRLVLGEAILKVSRELGPLCYKYKNVLLNTYMTACRSSLDEFRFSSFSNLSEMCRILTYQVHNYFQELLHLIDCELTAGKYLPAKRAAVMVLSDLLAGMDNLFDYEEMLLPIYRLLKFLVNSESVDEKIRIHASNGLQYLSEKCKKLIRAALEQNENSLEKEIEIIGNRDKPHKKGRSHILEIN